MEVPEKWETTGQAVEKSSLRIVLSLDFKILNSVEYITDRVRVFGNSGYVTDKRCPSSFSVGSATHQISDKHISLSETCVDDLKCV